MSRHGGSIILRVFHLPVGNPVKCSACAVKQKIETGNFGVFMGNLPISNEPVNRILRNLAGKYFSEQVNGLTQKN